MKSKEMAQRIISEIKANENALPKNSLWLLYQSDIINHRIVNTSFKAYLVHFITVRFRCCVGVANMVAKCFI
jgi:hypothetical protein